MSVPGAKERIHQAMIECDGVISGIHRFGGIEYKLGKRESGIYMVIIWLIYLFQRKSGMR
jgi:hypothetical protein